MNTNLPPSGRRVATLAALLALSVSSALAQAITNNTRVTTLTFDPSAGDLTPVPDNYGDRVNGVVDPAGHRYGPGSGGTTNVTVEYGPAGSFVRKAFGPYGGLVNVACQEDGDFGVLEIRLQADAGYQVALRSFDLAAQADDVMLPRVEVRTDSGAVLHEQEDVLVPGFRGNRTRFNFVSAPLVSGTVLIRLDLSSLANPDSHLVGIDNIAFSQVADTGCPPPPRLSITRATGASDLVVVSWPGTGYRLEMSSALGAGNWTTVGASSPVTLSTAGPAGFFRLVCP